MSDKSVEGAARLQALAARLTDGISRLERARRRGRWVTSALVVGLAGSLALSGAIIFDPGLVAGWSSLGFEVRAHRFVLEDEDGNVRGVWQLNDDGTVRLSIHDAAGHPRMNLSVLDNGAPGISFTDDSDRRRVVLGLLPDQTSTLVFADGDGVLRAALGVSDNGSSSLLFADGDGVSQVSLGLDASGAGSLMLPGLAQESDEEDFPEADKR
jgi:hypothetical protein